MQQQQQTVNDRESCKTRYLFAGTQVLIYWNPGAYLLDPRCLFIGNQPHISCEVMHKELKQENM